MLQLLTRNGPSNVLLMPGWERSGSSHYLQNCYAAHTASDSKVLTLLVYIICTPRYLFLKKHKFNLLFFCLLKLN